MEFRLESNLELACLNIVTIPPLSSRMLWFPDPNEIDIHDNVDTVILLTLYSL